MKDSYNDYGHKESSDGKVVEGTYRVALPDGRVQTVAYKSDDYSGYNAEVTYSGSIKAYDHKPADTAADYSTPIYRAKY